MGDIYLGFAILTALSAAAFRAARRITRSASVPRCNLLAVLLMAFMGWYLFHLWNNVLITRLLPFSNVVIVGNWFPPAAAFLAGLAWRRLHPHRGRRSVLLGGLALAGAYSMVFPLLGEHPSCDDRWRGSVCLQTSRGTCSAASAATLLRACGIDASEFEMAELCLTRKGTTWAGLYRGLKRKTAGTEWDVEVFQCSLDDLPRMTSDPVLLSVGIGERELVDPDYISDWGWIPGQPHSIVLFRFLEPNVAVIGDPAVGRELWSRKDLEVLWHGEGIRLVRREPEFHVAHRQFERN